MEIEDATRLPAVVLRLPHLVFTDGQEAVRIGPQVAPGCIDLAVKVGATAL